MKRRSFIKKSVATAIVAATPMALTGLVNADGSGGGTGSETCATWWPGSGEATQPETTCFTTSPATTAATTIVPEECPFDGEPSIAYQSIDNFGVNVCWNPGTSRSLGVPCAKGVYPCPQIGPNSTQPEIDMAMVCMGLSYAVKPTVNC